MAFSVRNLSVLAYAQGFTLWLYKAGQTDLNRVITPGYFDEAGDMLAAGDILLVSGREGAQMLCVLNSQAGLRVTPVL